MTHWWFAGIPVDSIRNEALQYTRGETTTAVLHFTESGDFGSSGLGFTYGGDSGATYGGDSGAVYGSGGVAWNDAESRYKAVLKYLEWSDTARYGRTSEGDVWVQDLITDSADVDSCVVSLEPSTHINLEDGVWAVLVDGTDLVRDPGALQVEVELWVLAEYPEYSTRTELFGDIGVEAA